MALQVEIRKNTYYDSVTLMLISKEIKNMQGVKEVLVGMGTELNKELAQNLGLSNEKIESLSSNDFFVAVLLDKEDGLANVVSKVDELLSKKNTQDAEDYVPKTIDTAIKQMPDANMIVISIPGKYAYREVKKALEHDLHIMLFSDNISIEEEKKLKEIARERGLLLMGPDCGTAIINQIPLAFANVVKKGNIGVVAASGTGAQEVSVLIDKFGGGVSQVIGTGGRDLSKDIGGIMMIEGIKALAKDPNTETIVLVSKPPAKEVADKVLHIAKESGKKIIVNFIGGDDELVLKHGLCPAHTLEDTAQKAVGISLAPLHDDKIEQILETQIAKLSKERKYLRGLYTGGTLCDEAIKLLNKEIGEVFSNIPFDPKWKLDDIRKSQKHTCIDLGDDVFTVGRAHPMIDPSLRKERLAMEIRDDEVAIILMDFVLGYGSNPDPVGEMIEEIEKAKDKICFISSVCGTESDPQILSEQEEKLKDLGVIIMPSNAQAVRLAAQLIKKLEERGADNV